MKPWLSIVAAGVLLFGCASAPTTPDWVNGKSAKYPDNQYLVGRGQADTLDEARNRARADLANEVVEELHRAAGQAIAVQADVSQAEAVAGMVERVKSELRATWPNVRAYVFGHMGDGNLHLVISPDGLPTDARAAVERMVYAPLQQVGGAISAEHGIGLEKKGWLSISRSPSEIALMRTLKQALDPNGILNPGRVV